MVMQAVENYIEEKRENAGSGLVGTVSGYRIYK